MWRRERLAEERAGGSGSWESTAQALSAGAGGTQKREGPQSQPASVSHLIRPGRSKLPARDGMGVIYKGYL